METTIMGYIGLDVGWVAVTGGYIGIMENKMETTGTT